ncbi:MAG: Bax inhibitor-1 family protein [Candidatus Velthaea sp.]
MYQRYSPARTTSAPMLLGQVLGLTAVGFLITACAAYLFQGVPYVVGFGATIFGLVLLFAMSGAQRNPALGLVLFYAFTFVEGIGIAPLISTYIRLDGSGVVVDAATTTGLGMLILGAIAFTFGLDWRRFSGVAFGALLALIVVSLIAAFTHFLHPGVIAWLTLAVFTLLTLIDFSRIRAAQPWESPVQLAVSIYLDAINIFLAFLQIFGNRSRN